MKKIDQPLRIVYDALHSFHSVRTLSGSERQVYDANTMYFNPDRRLDPLTLMVECGVNDPHGFINGLVNEHLTDVTWKISVAGVLTTILESNTEFKIGKGAEKGKLTVYKNISDTEEVTLTFSAKYLQTEGKRVANFQATFTLVTASEALAPAILELGAPYGEILYPFKNKNKGLVAEANLVRETENVAAAYWWYKNGVEITDINGFQNSKTNKLYVPMSQIDKKGTVYSVEVADCSAYLQQLRNEWVDADEKVVEWRDLYASESENLLVGNSSIEHRQPIGNSSRDLMSGLTPYSEYSVSFSYEIIEGDTNSLSVYCYSLTDSSVWTLLPIGVQDKPKGRLKLTFVPKEGEVDFRLYSGRNSKEASSTDIIFRKLKLEKGNNSNPIWSPNQSDLEALITQKQLEAESAVTLPANYRPSPKPEKLFKKEIVFIKRFGKYDVELLVPSPIPAEATVVHAELVIKNNQGIIENPENYFKAGWWKKPNGSYTYEGFVQDIPIAVLQQFIDEGKGWDIEVEEL